MSLEELVLNEPPEGPIVGRWDVKEVAENMREQLDIKDRKHMMRVQPMCFTGVEACAWMLSTGLIETEEQALQLGNSMVLNGLVTEVNMEHAFRNKPYMYRFAEDEWVRIGGEAVACARPMPYRKLMQLAQRMRREMGVGDMEQEGKVYQRCFTGVMCTGWLMHVGLADAEQDAVALGNALVRAGLVHHVARRRPLEASRRLYRFAADALALIQAAKRAALRGVIHPPHRRASRGAGGGGGGGSGASRRSSSASPSPSPPGAQIAAMMQLQQGDSDEDAEVDLEDILSSIAAAATPGGSLDAAAADPAATPRGSAISSCSGGGDGASSRGGSLCSGTAAHAEQRRHGGSGGGRSADSDDISLDAETADVLLRRALAPLAAKSNGDGDGDADDGSGGGSGGGSAGGSGHDGLAVMKKQARRQSKHVRGGPVWGSCELLPPTALATPMNDDAPPLWPDTACAAAAAAPSATAAAYDDAGICGAEDQFLLALLGIACQFPAPPRHRAWMDAPRKRSTSRGSVNAILSIVNAIDEDFTL